MSYQPKIIFIVGPTAIGKSDVAFFLARKINGEIISCDSMQVYKEIHIASNKPSPQMRREIPHHLIDVVSLDKRFDVGQFNDLANQAIQEILKKKKVPIITGGSGLYVEILLDGIFSQGDSDGKLRQEIAREMDDKGLEAVYEELKRKDPAAAQKIHLNDKRRIIRALEIGRTMGQPASVVGKDRRGLWGNYDIRLFGLNGDRQRLYQRIEKRVDHMFESGLVEEVKALQHHTIGLTAQGLIGVKEVLGYLNGEYDLEKAKYWLKMNTRHLAKKQLTWFRAEKRIQWIEINPETSLVNVADDILNLLDPSLRSG